MSNDVPSIAKAILNLSLVEVSDLSSLIKKELNLPDAPFAVPSAGAAPAVSDASKEPSAPTKFTLSLTHPGEKKVSAVKALRSIFSDIGQTLDLVSAKAKLDNLPYNVLEGISKEDADKHAETLKKAGCQYEIKAE